MPDARTAGGDRWLRIVAAAGELADGMALRLQAPLTPRDVHEIRVACKRLRALWRMLEPAFGSTLTRPPERQLRHVAGVLAGPRSAVVHGKTLRRLEVGRRDRELIEDCARLLAATAEAQCAPAPVVDDLASLMRSQAVALQGLPGLPESGDLARGIAASIRRARNAGRRAGRNDDPTCWHRCRRWAKYEHYQLQWALPLRGRWLRRHDRLVELGVLLGRSNDLADLAAEIPEALSATAHERLLELIRAARMPLQAGVERRFRRLYRHPASAHVERLERRIARS